MSSFRSPEEVAAVDLVVASPREVRFPGFAPTAFETLDYLKEHPHVDGYRRVKAELDRWVQGPFRLLRDDLVANWVLPSLLALETERNVFSRILKNDFGAGGSHHHLWLAFYRPGRSRLKDIQLAHGLHPEGYALSVFAAKRMGPVFDTVSRILTEAPARLLESIPDGYELTLKRGGMRLDIGDAGRADAVYIRRLWDRPAVEARGPALADEVLDSIPDVWPFYRLLLSGVSG